MFSSVVVTPERTLVEGLERLAVDSGDVSVYKAIEHYPSPYELVRLFNACDPDILFIDISNWEAASQIIVAIREKFPRCALVAFGGGWAEGQESYYAKVGISAHLLSPVTLETFQKGVAEAVRKVRSSQYKNLAAFLPAKAGTGCSLTVMHVASFLASLDRSVLVIDSDLTSGVLGLRWKLPTSLHLEDALSHPDSLSRQEWARFVAECNGVDVLAPSGDYAGQGVHWSNYYHLLEFVTKEYDHVLVDLPETVDDATSEVVQRAGAVFLVTGPDTASLALAQRRMKSLIKQGADAPRISLVLNRGRQASRGAVPPNLEQVLKSKVAVTLPADADAFRKIEVEGVPPSPSTSSLGHALFALASRIAGVQAPAEEAKPKFRLASFLGR